MKKIILVLCLFSVMFAGDIYSPNGRYEMKQISEMRRDQFIIDTQRGRIWTTVFIPYDQTKDPNNGFIGLSPVFFDDGSIEPNPAGVKNVNGRYKLDQISKFRRDQFLLDTLTGRVWQTAVTENNITIFQPLPYQNGTFNPDGIK